MEIVVKIKLNYSRTSQICRTGSFHTHAKPGGLIPLPSRVVIAKCCSEVSYHKDFNNLTIIVYRTFTKMLEVS